MILDRHNGGGGGGGGGAGWVGAGTLQLHGCQGADKLINKAT